MSKEMEYLASLDEPRRQAVNELTQMIRQRYPGATFATAPGEDDPRGTYVYATVETDDPDEVTDLTIERELALQIDEGIPVYVIPLRTPARAVAVMQRSMDPRRRHVPPPIGEPAMPPTP